MLYLNYDTKDWAFILPKRTFCVPKIRFFDQFWDISPGVCREFDVRVLDQIFLAAIQTLRETFFGYTCIQGNLAVGKT